MSGMRAAADASRWFGGADWLRSPPHLVRFAAIVGGLLFYIVASDRLGFIPTAVVLLFGWLILFRGRPASSLAIAVAVTLAVDYAFTDLLLVPLPLGLLAADPLLSRQWSSRCRRSRPRSPWSSIPTS